MKCPYCDGKGKKLITVEGERGYKLAEIKCSTCDGRGIIDLGKWLVKIGKDLKD